MFYFGGGGICDFTRILGDGILFENEVIELSELMGVADYMIESRWV